MILRIEAGNINSEWWEELYNVWVEMEGTQHRNRHKEFESDDEGDDETEVQRAHCQVMSDGQKFCSKVMGQLFNSPMSGAICHT